MKNTRKRNRPSLNPYYWQQPQHLNGRDVDTPLPLPQPEVARHEDEFEAFMADLHLMADREAFRLSEY